MSVKDGGVPMQNPSGLPNTGKPVSLALFDFDGTLIPGDSVAYYLRFARNEGCPSPEKKSVNSSGVRDLISILSLLAVMISSVRHNKIRRSRTHAAVSFSVR